MYTLNKSFDKQSKILNLEARYFRFLAKTGDNSARILTYLISQADVVGNTHQTIRQLYQKAPFKEDISLTQFKRALQEYQSNYLVYLDKKDVTLTPSGKSDQPHTSASVQTGTKPVRYYGIDPKEQADQIMGKLNSSDSTARQAIYSIALDDPKNSLLIVHAYNQDTVSGTRLLRAYRTSYETFRSMQHSLHHSHDNANQPTSKANPQHVAQQEYNEIAAFLKRWGRTGANQTYLAFTMTRNPTKYPQLANTINHRLTRLCYNLSKSLAKKQD